jgi:hypothetical protein
MCYSPLAEKIQGAEGGSCEKDAYLRLSCRIEGEEGKQAPLKNTCLPSCTCCRNIWLRSVLFSQKLIVVKHFVVLLVVQLPRARGWGYRYRRSWDCSRALEPEGSLGSNFVVRALGTHLVHRE